MIPLSYDIGIDSCPRGGGGPRYIGWVVCFTARMENWVERRRNPSVWSERTILLSCVYGRLKRAIWTVLQVSGGGVAEKGPVRGNRDR